MGGRASRSSAATEQPTTMSYIIVRETPGSTQIRATAEQMASYLSGAVTAGSDLPDGCELCDEQVAILVAAAQPLTLDQEPLETDVAFQARVSLLVAAQHPEVSVTLSLDWLDGSSRKRATLVLTVLDHLQACEAKRVAEMAFHSSLSVADYAVLTRARQSVVATCPHQWPDISRSAWPHIKAAESRCAAELRELREDERVLASMPVEVREA